MQLNVRGEGVPAHVRPGLIQRQLMIGGQLARGDQPRDARSDDRDLHLEAIFSPLCEHPPRSRARMNPCNLSSALHLRMPLPSTAKTKLLNLALYELGWFACVLGAAAGAPLAGAAAAVALTAAHVTLAVERRRELLLIVSVGLLGLALETALLPLEVLIFDSAPSRASLPPAWIAALWLQFATLLNYSLDWLSGRPLVAFVAGFVGGPLAFLAGERLGAATIGDPRLHSLLVLALVWGLVMPALFLLAARLKGPDAGLYRPWSRAKPAGGDELTHHEPARRAAPVYEEPG